MLDCFESYQTPQENVCTTSGIHVIPTLLLCIDDADAGGPFVGHFGVSLGSDVAPMWSFTWSLASMTPYVTLFNVYFC